MGQIGIGEHQDMNGSLSRNRSTLCNQIGTLCGSCTPSRQISIFSVGFQAEKSLFSAGTVPSFKRFWLRPFSSLTARQLMRCWAQSSKQETGMKFSVPKMSCGHCTSAIEKSIAAADPAAGVTCDLQSRNVAVTTGKSAADIAAAIKKAGYDSELLAG
jgi:copper chaperone